MSLQSEIAKSVGNPYHDERGRFTTGSQGLRVYHGTSNPGFTQFNPPNENEFMLDRALGVHVAVDPTVSNSFVERGGGVYPLKIAPDKTFLTVDQPLLPYVPPGTPKKPGNISSDQNAIEHLVMFHNFQKDPELLARYLEEARAVPKEDSLAIAREMSAGGKVSLPVDGPSWTLQRFINNFGGRPYNTADRAKASSAFRRDMINEGYSGLKYLNTSPMETVNAKDPTSFILFQPKHLHSTIDTSHVFGKLLKQLEYDLLEVDTSLIELRKAFNPNEARDKRGRWISVEMEYKVKPGNEGEDQLAIHGLSGKIGTILVDSSNPKHIVVSDIQSRGRSNSIGPRLIREVARGLKEHYPEAETISGQRVSGARTGIAYDPYKSTIHETGPGSWATLNTKLIKQLQLDLAKVERKLNKAYDPNEPRDKEGKWAKVGRYIKYGIGTAGTLAIAAAIGIHQYNELHAAKFHATQLGALSSILKEGIVPQKGVGLDHIELGESGYLADKLKEWQETAKGYTFVTTNLSWANILARTTSANVGGAKPIVLKLNVPKKDFITKFQGDWVGGSGAYKQKGTIPPEWIEGVYSRTGKFIPISRLQRLKKSEDGVTVYVVINPEAYLAQNDITKAYDPNEPRDKEGKWSKDNTSILSRVFQRNPKVLLHGTSLKALSDILENGIKPQGGPGADRYLVISGVTGEEGYNELQKTNFGYVFFTTDRSYAKVFADVASISTNSKAIVLKLEIPHKYFKANSEDDTLSYGGGVFKYRGTVNPNWIKGFYDDGNNYLALRKIDDQVVHSYVVLFFTKDIVKHLQDELMKVESLTKIYDPNS